MQIRKKEREGNFIILEVETDYAQFQASLEKTLAQASQNVKVAGFRPGKAPRALLEKQLNMVAVYDQATESLIADLYPSIITEAAIEPVDYPVIDLIERKEGSPIVFKIKIEVMPEVKLGKYKGLKAQQKSAEVSEEEVLHFLGRLQDRFATIVKVEGRPVEEGDLVDLDVVATSEEKPFVPLTRKGIKIKVGEAVIAPEFDQQVLGLSTGETKSFETTFKGDHQIKEIAGKTVKLEIKVLGISKRELEPLSDEFAKKISTYFSLAQLKEETRLNMQKEKEAAVEAEVKDQLVEAITQEATVEMPEALIDRETNIMLNEFEGSLSQSGLNLEGYLSSLRKTEKELKAEMRESALKRAKAKLVLRSIAEKEKLEVTEADIEQELKRFADEAGQTLEEFKATLQPATIDYVKDYLQRQKALEFVKEHAKITLSKEVKQLFHAD